jgi:hypothetical protein
VGCHERKEQTVAQTPDRDCPVDRELIRKLVEAYWRDVVLRGRRMGAQGASWVEVMQDSRELDRAFREQTEALAARLPPEQGQEFLQMIEEEADRCFKEHQSNHKAFYRRVGLTSRDLRAGNRNSHIRHSAAYQRQGIGEMAARTAVRATVWQLVRSLFRWW